MNTVRFKPKGKALVVVAHPDDETIWMGGTILKFSKLRWTIFSLCRSSDHDRRPKFINVCHKYRARAIITDLEDEERMSLKKSIPIIKKLITSEAGRGGYDYIFTHGQNGEYGHPRHRGVHMGVKELVKEGKLQPEAIFYFNYMKAGAGRRPSMKEKIDSDWKVKLTQKEFNKKKKIQAEMYGYPIDGIDVGFCTNPEAFRRITIK